MSWMPTVTTDEVYRATLVVEQRSLLNDHLIQTWSVHSKSYAKRQGATMWLNENIYDMEMRSKELLAQRFDGTLDTRQHNAYEIVSDGTGIYIAKEWELLPPKGKK